MANKKTKRESMVDVVINNITDSVVSGQFRPGDRLPTEMQLAEQIGVSKNTVREAIKTLVAYGVVEIRRPEGTFICDEFSQKMLNPSLYSILFSKSKEDDSLIGLRKVIDTGINQLIIEQGLSKEASDNLENILSAYNKELWKEEYNVKDIVDLDISLHTAMAKATNNELVVMLNDMLAMLTYESRTRTINKVIEENNRAYLERIHRENLDLLQGKGSKSIGEVVDDSYAYWRYTIHK